MKKSKFAYVYGCAAISAAVVTIGVGCDKLSEEESVHPSEKVEMQVSFTPEITRTAYEASTGEVRWVTGDKLAILYATPEGGIDRKSLGTATATALNHGADIKGSVYPSALPSEADEWGICAVSPESAYVDSGPDRMILRMPSEQIPVNGTYDPDAALLHGYTGIIEGEMDTKLKMVFTHVAAYGSLTVKQPSEIAPRSEKMGIRVKASAPMSGEISVSKLGEMGELSETSNTVTLKTSDWSRALMFGCLPSELSDTDFAISLIYADGVYEKVWHPQKFWFHTGSISNFGPSLDGGSIYALEGATLWSEDFEGVTIVNDASNISTKVNQLLGTYDVSSPDASCHIFWDANRSGISYSGSYAIYNETNLSNDICSGNIVETRNTSSSSSEWHFAVNGIPLCNAKKVKLTFGTNAPKANIKTFFDVESQGEAQPIAYQSEPNGQSSCTIVVPSKAKELSFKIFSDSRNLRYYDNFRLTVLESGWE